MAKEKLVGSKAFGKVVAFVVSAIDNLMQAVAKDYLTKKDASSTYQPKGNYLTQHQSLNDRLKTDGSNATANGVSAMMNKLTTGNSTPQDADYYICQWAGGGTATTTYHRRPMSALWNYIAGKADKRYLPQAGGEMTGTLTVPDLMIGDTDVQHELNEHEFFYDPIIFYLPGDFTEIDTSSCLSLPIDDGSWNQESYIRLKSICNRYYDRHPCLEVVLNFNDVILRPVTVCLSPRDGLLYLTFLTPLGDLLSCCVSENGGELKFQFAEPGFHSYSLRSAKE